MRGHADWMYADMVLMGAGALFAFNGEPMGWLALAIGIVLHQAAGGFATGF